MIYRNNQQIISQVLDHTQSKVTATKLIQKTNSNHKTIKTILEKLTSTNMVIKFENSFVITQKGRVYLDSWKKFSALSNAFGLEL